MNKPLKIIRNKIKIILLIATIFSMCMAFEKVFFTKALHYDGNYSKTQIIQIKNKKIFSSSNSRFDIQRCAITNSLLKRFLLITERKIDWKFLCNEWNNYSDEKKMQWIRGHIFVNDFGSGIVELGFYKMITYDDEIDILNAYTEVIIESLRDLIKDEVVLYFGDSKVKVIHSDIILPKQIEISKEKLFVTYSIFGFFLGLLLSSSYYLIKEQQHKI